MKKHLGWIARLLIAAAGVGYILYTLQWSDQVYLPAGYTLGEGIHGGDDGQSFEILSESDTGYELKPPSDGQGHGPDAKWIAKSELTAEGEGPRFEPSFMTLLGDAELPLLLAGLGVFAPVFLIGALRWTILMRARGIDVSFGRAYRLTMAGLFFNLCMPGTTGGDVMKAYYAARGTRQRADAVVSIAIDRVCGLVGLVLVVGCIGLLSFDDPLIRRLTISMWAGLVALVLIAGLYASKTLRARIRLGGLIGRVPGAGALRKLDALVAAYRNHVGALLTAIGLSVPIHLSLAMSMSLAGYALGVELPLLFLLGTIPIVFMLWSLPISGPLGLGPLDIVAVQLIVSGGDTTAQQAVMMFVAYRLFTVAIGLAGSLALVGAGAPSVRAAKEENAAAEVPA